MLEQTLLLEIYAEYKSWRAVARLIGKFSDAYWSLLANGRREWKTEHRNLVRQVKGLPPLEPPPLERIAAERIERVFKLSAEPNAAALFAIGDKKLVAANFRVAPAGDDGASCFATSCSITAAERSSRKRPVIDSMSALAKMTPASFATKRGQTGNLAAIAAAAQRAAEALTYPPQSNLER